jgi:hypothetical protein
MDPSDEMLFEITMKMFLGASADQTAGQVYNDKNRKELYRKALKKIVKRVQKIDTTTKHLENITHCAEHALKALSERPFSEPKLSILLLSLIGSLLGFTFTGTLPFYLRTYRTEAEAKGVDFVELQRQYYENSVSVRRRIVNQLKEEGLNDFQISLVLSTSEYQVRKLRKEL